MDATWRMMFLTEDGCKTGRFTKEDRMRWEKMLEGG